MAAVRGLTQCATSWRSRMPSCAASVRPVRAVDPGGEVGSERGVLHVDNAELDVLPLGQRLEAVDGTGVVPAAVDVLRWHRLEPEAPCCLGPVDGDPELVSVDP